MSFETVQSGALEYLRSDLISAAHAFSTRCGGVSEGALASLNLGVHRGDLPENVLRNYQILGDAVGFRPEDTVFSRQLHGAQVARVDDANRGEGLFAKVSQERDGLVTNCPRVALVVFSADCTPILLHDPVTGAVGAVHSGWRGTAQGIVLRAVEKLTAEFGAKPADLRAAIGPCIGPCCFETHADVPEQMRAALGPQAECAITRQGEKYHVDLKRLNQIWLERAGVEQIDVCPDCTCCQPQRFWSHRRVGDRRGSLAAVIVRKGGDAH